MIYNAHLPDMAFIQVHCVWCEWSGTANEADVKPDALARCPKCGEPVEKSVEQGCSTGTGGD